MHEAFAAQVASNIQALESETWAREKLGRSKALGRSTASVERVRGIDRPRPSLRGHGARITTTLATSSRGGTEVRPALGVRQGGWASRWSSRDNTVDERCPGACWRHRDAEGRPILPRLSSPT